MSKRQPHPFDVTPEQLEALAKPWEAGDKLKGLRVLAGVTHTSRPVRKVYYAPRESVGDDCWVIMQVLESGHHRAVIFATSGERLNDDTKTLRGGAERWVRGRTEPSYDPNHGPDPLEDDG